VAIRRLLESPAARDRRLEAAFAAPPGRLVFVCHGNIMRSAFAVAYLRARAPELSHRIVGAGTHAVAGRAAQDSAVRTAPEFGVSLDGHQAQPLALAAVDATDVVVCMDRANEANVVVAAGHVAERVFLVGDVGAPSREVVDPYGRGDDATRAAFSDVARLAGEWVRRFASTLDLSR
jgi:protein-tyrosine-phosphatase